jgi:hypothetical protein
MTTRPPLSPALSSAELRRWYWTLAELNALAQDLGVPRAGGKQALTERLAAALDGEQPPARARPASAGRQLQGTVTAATVIPPGQRCSQTLRAFFHQHIGPGFTFDSFMRDFVATGAGRTLGDAIAHWHATRAEAAGPHPIAPQFELNAFLRRWRVAHPAGTRDDALRAWREYRSLPVEERPAVPGGASVSG